ncbi:ribosome small subunit-dependent GTPase A [Flagellimonas okinawensis]|uniref:Small ribosomal subunit biogenesis GTPase RsgA n=1 Tax=Flagellimonas okinawensis TaxID=3031324 RepID=A0ABT5XRF8_9FLAO|nr:ribosome small subunit-dependent GTPase A [[Muricauda] okinawensis]MDF0708483.1 ribosome small subunit-dependent GTPase A [[Muricauda] okinawensis]
MKLEDLGYTNEWEDHRKQLNLDAFDVGRVIAEHKERYIVKNAQKEFDSEIIGNLRYTATSRTDFPAVGDWVAFSQYNDDEALIHAVLPRKTVIERQAVGKKGEKQLIATNIDYAFIVQAVDSDFNINRIERYLTICHSSKVSPIIILNKIDLIEASELKEILHKVNERIKDIPVFTLSNETLEGFEAIKNSILKSKTYCLLGSSGVGKSTLSNLLLNKQIMKTSAISNSTNKGKHTTSHRELLVLENGGIIIDNPGIREVGLTDSSNGIETTFDTITNLSEQCKFKDCTHTTETNCAVIDAVKNGVIDETTYQNFLRMGREKEHFESTVAEKRKKGKAFKKMVKNMKSNHSKYGN